MRHAGRLRVTSSDQAAVFSAASAWWAGVFADASGLVSRGDVAACAGWRAAPCSAVTSASAASGVRRGAGTEPLGAACLPLDLNRPSERNGRLLETEKVTATSPLTPTRNVSWTP